MNLARQYRPKKLKNVIGNDAVIRSVATILERASKDMPHVFLFTGPSGTGKTTLARIVAKSLGCHKNDFHEMDAASFRGIDTARQIRRDMSYLPGSGPISVWLLDECHQLTKDAQEALLKALEDTPEHVFFILATTDPDKLKKTLIRRCSHHALQAISDDAILKLMRRIITREGKEVPEDILEQIVEDAIGSPGIALAILDSVIDLDSDDMKQAACTQATLKNETIELCRALMKGSNWGTVAKILQGITSDPESVRRAVLGYFGNTLLRGGKNSSRLHAVMEAFAPNFYDIGRPGLIMAAYEASQS